MHHRIHPTAQIDADVLWRGEASVAIGEYVVIDHGVVINLGASDRSQLSIGSRSKIKWGVLLQTYGGRIAIGHRVSIGEYTVISGHGGVEIGENAILGPRCVIHAANHIFEGAVPIRFQGETAKGVRICNDVWLGAGVIVLDGVAIGAGSIVGAGSVVTRNIPEGVVAFGNPCKVQRRRKNV